MFLFCEVAFLYLRTLNNSRVYINLVICFVGRKLNVYHLLVSTGNVIKLFAALLTNPSISNTLDYISRMGFKEVSMTKMLKTPMAK